jgi:hypothetical protein
MKCAGRNRKFGREPAAAALASICPNCLLAPMLLQ